MTMVTIVRDNTRRRLKRKKKKKRERERDATKPERLSNERGEAMGIWRDLFFQSRVQKGWRWKIVKDGSEAWR